MRKFFFDLYIRLIAELVNPFRRDNRVRMTFTRKIGFIQKVNTLKKAAWTKKIRKAA